MQVKSVVIFICVIAGPVGFQWIGRHKSGSHRFFNFFFQLCYRTDAQFFFLILAHPDGQGRSPVAGAAQVPVNQIFEPVAKTSGTGSFGLPVDGFVQCQHLTAISGGADKPAIQRVIENGLIGTPAVWVRVFVLLRFEGTVFFFQLYNDVNVNVIFVGRIIIRGIFSLYIASCKFAHFFGKTALAVNQCKGSNAVEFSYFKVICTKAGRNVYDAGTIFGGYEIAGNHTESIAFFGLGIGQQLLITYAFQLASFPGTSHLKRNDFLSGFVFRKF